MTHEILGIVVARAGSKSLPGKNTALLAGRPLVVYTFEAAKTSRTLTRTIVSTDDSRVIDIAQQYGVDVPFVRPPAISLDDTPSIDVVKHALEILNEKEKYRPDIIVLLQPTSPLRLARHIDESVQMLSTARADSVVSVTEIPHQFHPGSALKIEKGELKPYRGDQALSSCRRQDKSSVYARNGAAVYVCWTKTIEQFGNFFGKVCLPYLMKASESVDIDNTDDLEIAEYYYTRRSEHDRD